MIINERFLEERFTFYVGPVLKPSPPSILYPNMLQPQTTFIATGICTLGRKMTSFHQAENIMVLYGYD